MGLVSGRGAPMDYTMDCQQTPPWQVILSKNGVLFFVPQAAVGCAANSGRTAHLAPGEARIPFYLGLGYPACGSSGEPEPAMPRCTRDPPGIPHLAPGRSHIGSPATSAPIKPPYVPPLG